jgi:hypothetical protein
VTNVFLRFDDAGIGRFKMEAALSAMGEQPLQLTFGCKSRVAHFMDVSEHRDQRVRITDPQTQCAKTVGRLHRENFDHVERWPELHACGQWLLRCTRFESCCIGAAFPISMIEPDHPTAGGQQKEGTVVRSAGFADLHLIQIPHRCGF